MAFHRPNSVEAAVACLSDPDARVIAGGTDFYPALGDRMPTGEMIDLSGVDGLSGVTATPDGWRIGATTTWSALCAAALPPAFDGLKAAARAVGGVQIQNAGTIAGNLCNASPAADGVPPLLALDASVELTSADGVRTLPLSAFMTGPRRTALRSGEIVTAIDVPNPGVRAVSAFEKLGSRRHLVISIAMVAVVLVPDRDERIAEARVAVGACTPVACRLPALEQSLVGKALSDDVMVVPKHLAPLSPIDDVRGTAAYRTDAVATLCERAIARAARAVAI